jgi:hypothetical protein
VPTAVPPQLAVYQASVAPEPPIAVSVTEPPSLEQRAVRSDAAEVGDTAVEGVTFTVTFAQPDGVQLVVSHLAK